MFWRTQYYSKQRELQLRYQATTSNLTMKMFFLALSLFLVGVASALPAETVTAPLTRRDAANSLLLSCITNANTCFSCCTRALTQLSDRRDLLPRCYKNCQSALSLQIIKNIG
ncbi:uncharacterized protein [Littorina saxatilis]|uniref:Uncharacterized protein n=1 Tax=Littorina saxatilis TaxID=31220 RepID=A0AAN9GEM6_9CAEN